MKIGEKEFVTDGSKTYVMGILNLTPDSFSDGGKYLEKGALKSAEHLIECGADLIDLGAESTRPGASYVDAEEEKRRLLPVIRIIREEFDIPISVDTYKPEVARAALELGADLINDVNGLFLPDGSESGMAELIAESGAPVVIMHNDFEPIERSQRKSEPADIMERVRAGLAKSLNLALERGVKPGQIILDPGIGFGKDTAENLGILNRLGELRDLGYPLLLGASRKRVIGDVLGGNVAEREEGTIVTSILAAQTAYSFVRVHNVRSNRRALDMLAAVKQA
ncbi:MAG: dihydropteroate synthase [Lachnospiraceae bacterium]|nr:dihydropteroate synthase [Lachnospiraceae bacterium]